MAEAKKAQSKKTAPKKTAVKDVSNSDQLAQKRADYHELQKSHAAGELVNPRALTRTRKDIARLLTKINAEKEAK